MQFELFGLKVRPVKVFAAFGVVLTASCGCASPALANQGWVLTQKSTKMGDQYVYISDQGLKISNPRAGFNLVTRAPNWDITLYNDKTRCFYETTADRYKQQLAGRGSEADLKGATWEKSGTSDIQGLKATEYRMGSKTVRSKNKNGTISQKTIGSASYWVASDIIIPPKLTELLGAAYGLPTATSSCVPLRLKYNEASGEHTVLDTYRVDKSPLPVAYFDKPQGYKLVTSDAEVMMNDEQKQIMNDMAHDLDTSPQNSELKAKVQAVQAGNTNAAKTFTKDDVSKLMDMFNKKKQQ